MHPTSMHSCFLFNSGDCDHLELYAIYSQIQHDINLTIWDKPWPPEIDFLDSYVNLSSYHPIFLEALAVGYRTTKNAKYFYTSEWGCLLMFQYDFDLADQYYLEHYADTNDTMYICTPRIPVRPDLRRKYAETHPNRYNMVRCDVYQLGYFKRLYQMYHWSYIFSADYPFVALIYDIVIAIISIVGIFGELEYLVSCVNLAQSNYLVYAF